MKINYVRRESGKRTTINLPDSICKLWLTTRPPVSESAARKALCELFEKLDDPIPGITFQSQVERVMLNDIRLYQNRLLASNDELKRRVIDWITNMLPGMTPPTPQASEILAELDKLKLVPWEMLEKFDSLEDQRWK